MEDQVDSPSSGSNKRNISGQCSTPVKNPRYSKTSKANVSALSQAFSDCSSIEEKNEGERTQPNLTHVYPIGELNKVGDPTPSPFLFNPGTENNQAQQATFITTAVVHSPTAPNVVSMVKGDQNKKQGGAQGGAQGQIQGINFLEQMTNHFPDIFVDAL